MVEILFVMVRASVLISGRIRKRLSGNEKQKSEKKLEMKDVLWFGMTVREKRKGEECERKSCLSTLERH